MAAAANGQPTDARAQPIKVVIRWTGQTAPTAVNVPNGAPFTKQSDHFEGALARPNSGVKFQDLDVNFGDESYPLRLRVYPALDDVDITVALEPVKSCADVYLRQLEKPTLTEIASVRAAFTLNNLVGRVGQNSCSLWPLRAEKARYDRYYNAMERSDVLVIPEAVKAAYLSAAGPASGQVQQVIASGDEAEQRRYARSVQRVVIEAAKQGDYSTAARASSDLLDASRQPEYSSAVAKEIRPAVLSKQTTDLSIRAGNPPPLSPQ
jgi:hypothetical protein